MVQCKSSLLNKVKNSNLVYMKIMMNFVVKGVENSHLTKDFSSSDLKKVLTDWLKCEISVLMWFSLA